MKKTPIAGQITKQLIRANDQICFASCQQWEFTQRLCLLAANAPKKYTTELFPGNPFAKAIYRKGEELPEFAKTAQQVALQMGVIAAMEYVLAYVEDVQSFRARLVLDVGEAIKHDAEEEQLRQKVAKWKGENPTVGYFWTLGYFRLLRNHYAHANEEPHNSLQSYMRSYGSPLNSFWNNGVTDIHGIDFRTLPMSVLTPDLAFGIMNVLRVSVQHIDHMIAETITLKDAVRWTVELIRSAPANKTISTGRLISKVSKRLDMEWAIIEPMASVAEHIQPTEQLL